MKKVALTLLCLSASLLLLAGTRWLWLEGNKVGTLERIADKHGAAIEAQISRVLDGDPKAADPEDRKSLRGLLSAKVDSSGDKILGELDLWRKAADSRLASIQGTASSMAGLANDRTLQALNLVNDRTGQALTQLADTQKSINGAVDETKSTMTEIKSTVNDFHESWDSNYDDMVALLGSATVAATSTAQTLEVIRDYTPKISNSVSRVGESVAREADELTKPKKWWQKLLGPVYTIGRLVALIIQSL